MKSQVNLLRRWPLLLSLLLHLVLFGCLFFAFVPTAYRLPGKVDPKAVITVQAISQRTIDRVEKQRADRLRRIRLAKLRQQRLRALRRRQALQRAKKRAQKIKQQRLAKQQRAQRKVMRQKLLRQQQQIQQQSLAKQLQQESTKLQKLTARQANGIVDRYIPQIKMAIQQRWRYPPGTDPKLTCKFVIQLAPGGMVLTAKLIDSSGNVAVDRSAKQAILLASPLPVPNNPALFDRFRVLHLTMHPGILQKTD